MLTGPQLYPTDTHVSAPVTLIAGIGQEIDADHANELEGNEPGSLELGRGCTLWSLGALISSPRVPPSAQSALGSWFWVGPH